VAAHAFTGKVKEWERVVECVMNLQIVRLKTLT